MNAYTSFPAEFEAVRPIYNVLIATTTTMWLIDYIVTVLQTFGDSVRAIALVSAVISPGKPRSSLSTELLRRLYLLGLLRH
jgi:hypothetical protein